jgi:hypothetical protein
MKTKHKLPLTGLLLLLAQIAKAYIWIVISLLVAVVGGVASCTIYQVAKLVDQPNDPQPDVTRVWMDDNFWNIHGFIFQCGLPPAAPLDDPAPGISPSSTPVPGFSLQYGLDTDQCWIMPGTNIVTKGGCCIGPTTGTISNFTFTVWGCGQILQFYFDPTNGYTSQILADEETLHTLVIERTRNLRIWTPVYTNSEHLRWTTETWTDTNLFAFAFYRVRQDQ